MNGQQELLIEFDDKIFNALVEKIEILEPTHFVFVLRNGIRMEEILE
ncbi:recombinase [Clostridium sp. DJ247]|nr:recombinase [Clostridium sp. DJ247]